MPFLDQRLARAVRELSPTALIGNGVRKKALKQLFASELQPLNIERKKGFSSPLLFWWQKGLEDLARRVFESSRWANEHEIVRKLIVTSQKRGQLHSLITLFSLCLWEDYWMGERRFIDEEFILGSR